MSVVVDERVQVVEIDETNIEVVSVGVQGPPGPQGPQGSQGPAGPGVPTGGGTGQALLKNSGTDYDTSWAAVVNSLNTRTGAVTLQSSDVTTALGFSDISRTSQANNFLQGQSVTLSGSGAVSFLTVPVQANSGNTPALTWYRSGDTTQAASISGFAGSGTSASSMNLVLSAASSGGSPAASLSMGSRFQRSQFNSNLTVAGQRTGDVTLTVKAASAQTADLLQLTNSVGTVLVKADINGVLTTAFLSCNEVDCSGAVNGNSFAGNGFFVNAGGDLQSNSVTTGNISANNVTANTFTGDGSGLGNLNAANVLSGTLADARLSSNVVLKNAANTFTVGPQTIQTGASGTKGLIVQGAASQSANLQEWQDSSGNRKTYIDQTGALTTINNVPIQFTNTGGTVGDYIHLDNANNFAVRNNAGSGNAFYGVNSGGGSCIFQTAGANRVTIDTNGTTTFTGTNVVRLIPKAAANATADLEQWQDSNATVLGAIGSSAAVPRLKLLNSPARSNTVTNKALTSNVATLTTASAHNYAVGETVVVAGVDATFNGTFVITVVGSSTTFSYAKTAGNVASQAATGTTSINQTGNLLEFQDGTGTKMWSVDGTGTIIPNGVDFVIKNGTGSNVLRILNGNGLQIDSGGINIVAGALTLPNTGGTLRASSFADWTFVKGIATGNAVGDTCLRVKGLASQSGNLCEWQDSTGAALSTVSENGYFTTRKNTVPADAELSTGEAAFWFDSTAGAAKLMVKAKNASGTVVTGSITLS